MTMKVLTKDFVSGDCGTAGKILLFKKLKNGNIVANGSKTLRCTL